MKKLWINIKIFLHYLFAGMAVADKEITRGGKDLSSSDNAGIEQKKEVDNVYSQMLRGEVTEEVKELRYEMYQADRKSHEYVYSGGGMAKKNNVFSFDGSIYDEDGLEVEIVQENDATPISLTDYGIVSYGEYVYYDDTKDRDPDELHDCERRIHVKYDYIPRFKIENFAKKIVVKKVDDDTKRVIDLYFSEYPSQFERMTRLFSNYLKQVFDGEERPYAFDIQAISFISYKAYGTDATKLYAYINPKYLGINKFDGNFVVSFIADVEENGTDLLTGIYHEKTAEKIKNNEARKGAVLNLIDVAEAMKEPDVSAEEANKIFNEVKDNG